MEVKQTGMLISLVPGKDSRVQGVAAGQEGHLQKFGEKSLRCSHTSTSRLAELTRFALFGLFPAERRQLVAHAPGTRQHRTDARRTWRLCSCNPA